MADRPHGMSEGFGRSLDVVSVGESRCNSAITLVFEMHPRSRKLLFADGFAEITISGSNVLLGDDQIVVENAMEPVNTNLDTSETSIDVIVPGPTEPPPLETNLYAILTPATPSQYIAPATSAQVIDASGGQQIHVGVGASLQLQGSVGNNTISVQGASDSFTISHDVGKVLLTGSNGEVISFDARLEPQKLVFWDGAAEIKIEVGDVVLGAEQIVSDSMPEPITAGLDDAETSLDVFPLPVGDMAEIDDLVVLGVANPMLSSVDGESGL